MSLKTARGTKRVCQNCGSKFYDLNKPEIICPICNTVFQQEGAPIKPALAGNNADDDDDDVLDTAPGDVEIVSLEDAGKDEEIPDLEDDGIVDIDDDDSELAEQEETFIEVEEDESEDDVTGIVSGSREEDDDT